MDLQNSIVGIVAKSNSTYKYAGTGFFVEGGYLLTCMHVVNDAQITDGRLQFRIEGGQKFYEAEVIPQNTAQDVCLLKPVNLDVNVPVLRLVASRQSNGHPFKAFGYPQKGGFDGLHADGKVMGWVTGDHSNRDALQLSSDELTHGYSGCPVWDETLGGVVGMVGSGFDFGLDQKLGDAVFAVPSEILKNVYPDLKLDEVSSLNPGESWYLKHPYPMPPHFTGRAEERKMLSDWLNNDNENRLLILRALGGFGKSALTWHWLTNDVNVKQWPKVVFWSFYEGDASFEHFVEDTLKYFKSNLPQGQRPQTDELIKAMQSQNILLILDGFERVLRLYGNMDAIYQNDEDQHIEDSQLDCANINAETFLKGICSLPNIKGKVLMTTRLTPRIINPHGVLLLGCREEELTAMQKEDAVAFFQKQKIKGTRLEIENACAPYGYHPLSLRILAGLILNNRESPGNVAITDKFNITDDIIQNRNHVLKVSYDSLSSEQQKLLNNMSCFRSAISFQALKYIVSKPSWKRKNKIKNHEKLNISLSTLESYGLVNWDRQKNNYDLHPIVRRYAYAHLTTMEQIASHSRLCDFFKSANLPEHPGALEDIAPAIELYYHMTKAGQRDEAIRLYKNYLNEEIYFHFGAYQLEIELLSALFTDRKNNYPSLKNKASQSWALNALANAYSVSGQPHQSLPLFKADISNISGESSEMQSVIVALGNIANAAQIPIGKLKDAENSLYHRADLCRKVDKAYVHSENKSKTRESKSQKDSSLRLHNYRKIPGHWGLGRLFFILGQFDASENELNVALTLSAQEHAIQSECVVWAYRALRFLLMSRNDAQAYTYNCQLAIDCVSRALELADDLPNQRFSSPRDYIRTYWLLGMAHRMNHDLDKAEGAISKAISLCRQINMVDHEADILLELAKLSFARKDLKNAKESAEEALTITERCGYVLQGADVNNFLAELTLTLDPSPEGRGKARQYAETALKLATCDGPPYYYKVAYEEAERLLEKPK